MIFVAHEELTFGGGEVGDRQVGEMYSVSEDVKCYVENEAMKGTGKAELGYFKWGVIRKGFNEVTFE